MMKRLNNIPPPTSQRRPTAALTTYTGHGETRVNLGFFIAPSHHMQDDPTPEIWFQ